MVTGASAWAQLVAAMDWPGLTKSAAAKRWKHCIQQYCKYSQPPRTCVGNENQVYQKNPPDWVKRLDRWFSTKKTHNPDFIMDPAATQLEKSAENQESDGFRGAAGLVRATEMLNDENEMARLREAK